MIKKTYKYRLYPNNQQKQMLQNYFGCVRFVYNHFLSERKKQYEETGSSHNYYDQSKELTELKKNPIYFWLKEINSQTLQQSLRHLDTAYVNFFRGNTSFPRFHSKKNGGSFAVPQNFKVENGKIYLPKFKDGIKIIESRKCVGELRNMTISVTGSGKYFVSIMAQVEYQPLEKTNQKVGIDLGIKDFVITSEGEKYPSNKFINRYSRQLATAQKHLARKRKGSNTWNRQRVKVARIQEKISNCRFDKLQNISTDLIRKYDTICCEDLNVKGMQHNHHLAKSIADASWGTFLNMLQYKADWNGKEIIKIGRFFPSSKTCNHCGHVNENLKLSDRTWICTECGESIDRDLNAAMNILDEGLKNKSAGTVDHTDGDKVRPTRRRLSVKSEAHEPLAHG